MSTLCYTTSGGWRILRRGNLLLVFLLLGTIHHEIQAQQQRRRRHRTPVTFTRKEHPSETTTNNDNDQQPQGSQQQMTLFLNHNLNHPRHVLEGIQNIIKISLPLAMVGTVSLVGIPLWVLATNYRSHGLDAPILLLSAITASLAGGLVGSTCLISSFGFASWQLIVGLIQTPKALWARFIQQKTYYSQKEQRWKQYNLKQHMIDLKKKKNTDYTWHGNNDPSFLYQTLGIETTATSKEIKKAYYQLAKLYHPDKNKDQENNNNNNNNNKQFLKVHAAYETLSNPNSRRDYDLLGITTSNNKLFFDTGIFLDVLFGISPEVEPYIGDLEVKSIASRLVTMVLAVEQQQREQQQPQHNESLLTGFLNSFANDADHAREVESRQVHMAVYLQEFIAEYAMEGTMTEHEFEKKCKKEATLVAASSSSQLFVKSIGEALYWQGHKSLYSPIGIPMYLASMTRSTYKGMERWTSMIHGLFRFVQGCQAIVEKVEYEASLENSVDEKEIKERLQNKLLEEMAGPFMTLVWEYNEWDIASTMEEAYWKVIHDTSAGKLSWKQKSRQARAMRMLGTAFLEQVAAGSHVEESFLELQDRVRIAYQMATAVHDKDRKKKGASFSR